MIIVMQTEANNCTGQKLRQVSVGASLVLPDVKIVFVMVTWPVATQQKKQFCIFRSIMKQIRENFVNVYQIHNTIHMHICSSGFANHNNATR